MSFLKSIMKNKFIILALFSFIPASLFAQVKQEAGSISKTSLSILKKNYRLNHTASYYKNQGDHYKSLGDFQKAIKNYEFALLLDKESGECYFSLGEIYYKEKLYLESNSNLKVAVNKKFEFYFDKIKAIYLLAITYFYNNKEDEAVQTLKDLITQSQVYLLQEREDSPLVNADYYAPAYFILCLYFRNNDLFDIDNNINYLQRALQLNYKKEYIDYFLYEYYNSHKQFSTAFEFLIQSKMIDPQIESKIKTLLWLKNYDIFMDISKQ